ncbi:GNAT family N-acetyltransferase [Nonomuraea jiangxiensis]|uniref:Acetyltransferase (GNAT) family protein n=1 Tax=Nonomuraea jiangxiensis TaxID=633440 RepID=A0A1G8Y8U6_9ACTN|nr:GNAT family N-acetyltransferase [Nonomuraea jiangxiensis]SDJ99262.1 Acetyltransferase (GNAT) family protein [Nonomuraea jiangxiensis]
MHGTQIRPACPDDEERIARFLAGLSLQTQTMRFFTGFGVPASGLVHALIAVDERRDALVATEGGEIVGHAMSYLGRCADVEIAVVVADQWQGFGLGPELVERLLLRAALRGARTVGMDVMGENRRVLRLIRRIWPDAVMKVASGTVEVTAMIDQAALFAEQRSGGTPLTL